MAHRGVPHSAVDSMTLAGRHVLFVQHAGTPGGSVVSLRYLVDGLIAAGLKVSVVMAIPHAEVRELYESCGAEVHDIPSIVLFRHTTAGWASLNAPRACVYQVRSLSHADAGHRALLRLIEREGPDLVHLNSVTLALTARALSQAGLPLVWHVRESPVSGYFGVRRDFLRRSLMAYGDEVVFLSDSDRHDWVRGERGAVVPNVVPIKSLPTAEAVERERARFGIDQGDRAIAYVGGLARIKGIFPLAEAARRLYPRYPGLRILAPGAIMPPPTSFKGRIARAVLPRLGLARDYEQALRILEEPGLKRVFRQSGFVHDILPVIAATEFLVFPSTVPHFARPVVESAMVARPAIGSDLPGVRDLIDDGETGRLVPAGDVAGLMEAIESWLEDPGHARNLGITAQERARERFDSAQQVEHVLRIYGRVLAKHRVFADGPRSLAP